MPSRREKVHVRHFYLRYLCVYYEKGLAHCIHIKPMQSFSWKLRRKFLFGIKMDEFVCRKCQTLIFITHKIVTSALVLLCNPCNKRGSRKHGERPWLYEKPGKWNSYLALYNHVQLSLYKGIIDMNLLIKT